MRARTVDQILAVMNAVEMGEARTGERIDTAIRYLEADPLEKHETPMLRDIQRRLVMLARHAESSEACVAYLDASLEIHNAIVRAGEAT